MNVSQEIFSSRVVSIGIFRCPTGHPAFSQERNIGASNHIVFPRTSVVIRQEGYRPVVADPNVAILYNHRQHYERRKLSTHGDNSDWYAMHPETIVDALRFFDPTVHERSGQPFANTHAMVSPTLYLQQRRLLNYVRYCEEPDRMLVEVNAMHLVEALLSGNQKPLKPLDTPRRRRASRDLSEAARQYLARHYRDRITLSDLARHAGCSEFHLSRVFRTQTGVSLHRYLIRLRVCAALDQLGKGKQDLTTLAHELGFSSHSHFTSCFRQTFNTTPSAYRASTGRRSAEDLRKFLIAS